MRKFYIITIIFFLYCHPRLVSQVAKKKYVPKTNATKKNEPIKTKPKVGVPRVIPNKKADLPPQKSEPISIPKADTLKPKAQKPVTGPLEGPKSYSSEKKEEIHNNQKLVAKPSKQRKYSVFKEKINYGLKWGMNLADIKNFSQTVYSGTIIPESKPIARWQIGALASYQFAPKLGVQAELIFSQQGSQIADSMNRYIYKINYLTFPIILKTTFHKKGWELFANMGPYLAYSVYRASDRTIGGVKMHSKIEFQNEFNAFGEKDNRFDFGPVIGVGVIRKLPKFSIGLEARYQHGMIDPIIYKADKPVESNGNGRARLFSITTILQKK